MRVKDILRAAYVNLKLHKIKNPHLEAEILLSNVLKKNREWLLSHPGYSLRRPQITNYKLQISKRCKNVPLAYITGHKQFYGRDFIVNKSVLIPRPETELMVGEVLKKVRSEVRTKVRTYFIDVGAGSGCIIISLCKVLSSGTGEFRTLSTFMATDISSSALTVARKNAKLHDANKINFLNGDLLNPVIHKLKKIEIRNSKFVICANLPYLTSAQHKSSPTIQYEPKNALLAGPDGLKYYRSLFKQINDLNKISNFKFQISNFIEISPSQKYTIKTLAQKHLSGSTVEIKKDLRGHSRLAIIKIN